MTAVVQLPAAVAPETASPGLAGFLAMFALALATVVLIRSMVKHLRKVRYGPDAGAPGREPAQGSAPGSAQESAQESARLPARPSAQEPGQESTREE